MTLLELKMKKAELRNRMDEERERGNLCIEPETFIEYQDVIRALKWAESRLLRPIVISLLLVLISIFASGCGTFEGMSKLADGVRRDVHHITQPTTQE